MSDDYTQDTTPAASGTIDAAIQSDLASIFGELRTFYADMKDLRDRVTALDASANRAGRKPLARQAGTVVKTPTPQPPVTDPQAALLLVVSGIAGATRQLGDDDIAAYADQVKSAMLALRAGTYPPYVDPGDVKSRSPTRSSVRDALLAALAGLARRRARPRSRTPPSSRSPEESTTMTTYTAMLLGRRAGAHASRVAAHQPRDGDAARSTVPADAAARASGDPALRHLANTFSRYAQTQATAYESGTANASATTTLQHAGAPGAAGDEPSARAAGWATRDDAFGTALIETFPTAAERQDDVRAAARLGPAQRRLLRRQRGQLRARSRPARWARSRPSRPRSRASRRSSSATRARCSPRSSRSRRKPRPTSSKRCARWSPTP